MIQPQQLGTGCLFSRPEVFASRAEMLDRGEIGHVQLMMIPGTRSIFANTIEVFESYRGKIRVHAPHHIQKVNPCAPDLFAEGDENISEYIDQAMEQTFEAADRTGSDIIVLHAGRYLQGEEENALSSFSDFLDRYPDNRYVLETLPDLAHGPRYLGITPDELIMLGNSGISGYCIDFPHLWCTSISKGISYQEMLTRLEKLPIRFSHLSGTPGPHTDRQHLFFDDPENRFNPDWIRSFLDRHPDLEVSLEFGTDDPTPIRKQLTTLTSS